MSTKYHGFANKETSVMWDFICNHDRVQSRWLKRADTYRKGAVADATWTASENAAFLLRDRLKEVFQEDMAEALDDLKRSNYVPAWVEWVSEFITDSFAEVNWLEIARNLLDD